MVLVVVVVASSGVGGVSSGSSGGSWNVSAFGNTRFSWWRGSDRLPLSSRHSASVINV